MRCLGECHNEFEHLCAKSGKCITCCDNECGCGYAENPYDLKASASRYDNLCEAKYLRQQELSQ